MTAPPSMPSAELATPPADIQDIQREFWSVNARLAVERRTLVPATVPAFRLLCELHARKVAAGQQADKGDVSSLRLYAQLAKQVENLMGRFCLAPFGKPVDGAKPKDMVNPFRQIAV